MIKNINITVYFIGCWLFGLYLSSHFLQHVPINSIRDQIHYFLLLTTYSLMYQAPAILAYWLLKKWHYFSLIIVILLSLLSHLVIFADSHLYDLYGFHLNGFVWNLLITPGGIDSLGADQTNISLVLSYVSVLLAVHLISLFLAVKVRKFNFPIKTFIIIFFLSTLTERFIYAYSRAQLYAPVLMRADAMLLYQPMTINSLLKYIGVEVKKVKKVKMSASQGELQYPKHPILLEKIKQPLNIIMLISESMRFDLLTPKIMPNLFSFAQKNLYFKQHYSGGNGTRQGLFSFFYGIQGNYWDMFLRNKREPVLFNVLNEYNYEYFIYTGANFTYPELDQTIFSKIPKDKLIETNQGEPWQRDQINTTLLLNKLKAHDKKQAYFGFIFYESTHARYSFSDKNIIRQDYLKNLDYAGLSREELAPQISGMKARYENAAHGIDGQIQRIINYLETSGEIEHTLFIVTGDHGEEFLERGRWGHNSGFTDWQVRVPMVISIPGIKPKTITQRTSHMDISPTLLTRLGVKNPVKDYSLGRDIVTPIDNRTVIVASWTDIGLINNYGKLVIPFKSTTQHKNLTSSLEDEPVNSVELTKKMQAKIIEAINNSRYYNK